MAHGRRKTVLTTVATELATIGSLAFGIALFALQALAFVGGRLLGRWKGADDTPEEGGGILVGSMLGLLGFVLALTLSHANARFEERRQNTLAEANAIGTAWLQAGALHHPKADEIAEQLRDYARLRLAFVLGAEASLSPAETNRRTSSLQTDIWQNLSAITRDRNDAVAASFMGSLNEVFDRATAERFAFALAIPPQILLLIVVLPTLALGTVGFHLGRRRDRQRLLPLVLIGMQTCVVTLILDLGSPRLGDIRPSGRAYEWTISGFAPGGTTQERPARR